MDLKQKDFIITELEEIKRNSTINITLLNGTMNLVDLILENTDDIDMILKYCDGYVESLRLAMSKSHKNYDAAMSIHKFVANKL